MFNYPGWNNNKADYYDQALLLIVVVDDVFLLKERISLITPSGLRVQHSSETARFRQTDRQQNVNRLISNNTNKSRVLSWTRAACSRQRGVKGIWYLRKIILITWQI
jgi:hypothetical protein